jgi:hypothetical protein
MFSKKIFSLLLSLAIAASWSCKKDSEPSPVPAPASMECKVDNSSWKAATFTNTLIRMTTSLYTGKRLDIRGTAQNGSMIILSISDPSTGGQGDGIKLDTYYINIFQNLPSDYQSGMPAKGAIGTYTVPLAQKLFLSDFEAPEGQITITACDAAKKTISGNFFFKATNPVGDSGVSITSGTFTNLSYTAAQ